MQRLRAEALVSPTVFARSAVQVHPMRRLTGLSCMGQERWRRAVDSFVYASLVQQGSAAGDCMADISNEGSAETLSVEIDLHSH